MEAGSHFLTLSQTQVSFLLPYFNSWQNINVQDNHLKQNHLRIQ